MSATQTRLPGRGWGRRPPPPSEHAEQAAFFARCAARAATDPDAGDLKGLFAVPNGAYYGPDPRTRAIIGARMHSEGMQAGVPDVVLPVPRPRTPTDPPAPPGTPPDWWVSLYLELKRQRGGRLAPEQQSWHEWLRAQGCQVVVCPGADAAYAAVCAYLGLPEEG